MNSMQDIWVEKYRPKKLDDIVGQDDIMERLKAYVKTKTVPHMIFAGPAGVGKTTSVLALAREVFGEETWKQNFHELNASDERGIGFTYNRCTGSTEKNNRKIHTYMQIYSFC